MSTSDCLLVFFHTGCPDCRRELPTIEEFHKLHPSINVIAISREESDESIARYWKGSGLTMAYSAQKDRNIYGMFIDSGIPYTVVSRKGTIAAIYTWEQSPSLELLENGFGL